MSQSYVDVILAGVIYNDADQTYGLCSEEFMVEARQQALHRLKFMHNRHQKKRFEWNVNVVDEKWCWLTCTADDQFTLSRSCQDA